jgi:hypothetical protein
VCKKSCKGTDTRIKGAPEKTSGLRELPDRNAGWAGRLTGTSPVRQIADAFVHRGKSADFDRQPTLANNTAVDFIHFRGELLKLASVTGRGVLSGLMKGKPLRHSVQWFCATLSPSTYRAHERAVLINLMAAAAYVTASGQ